MGRDGEDAWQVPTSVDSLVRFCPKYITINNQKVLPYTASTSHALQYSILQICRQMQFQSSIIFTFLWYLTSFMPIKTASLCMHAIYKHSLDYSLCTKYHISYSITLKGHPSPGFQKYRALLTEQRVCETKHTQIESVKNTNLSNFIMWNVVYPK